MLIHSAEMNWSPILWTSRRTTGYHMKRASLKENGEQTQAISAFHSTHSSQAKQNLYTLIHGLLTHACCTQAHTTLHQTSHR